jgi:hypothetical protein
MDTGSGTAKRSTVMITQIIVRTGMIRTPLAFMMGSMLDTTPVIGKNVTGDGTITAGANRCL